MTLPNGKSGIKGVVRDDSGLSAMGRRRHTADGPKMTGFCGERSGNSASGANPTG